MYITRLELTKIRCFEHLEIEFNKPGSSILILGNNRARKGRHRSKRNRELSH